MAGPVDEMLDFGDKLPSFPTAIAEAIRLLSSESADNDQIATVLQRDQGLVAQVLKLANSPFYGVSRRVSTVKQALLVLGRNAVRSLVVAAGSQEFLSRPQPGYLLARGQLWEHSMAAGTAAGLVAAKVHYRPSDEAFVAGLLHDIGKVVLSEYLAERSAELAELLDMRSETMTFNEIELEMLHIDHATLGGLLCDHWQLPPRLGRAVRFHLRPGDAGDDWQLASVVHAANALTLAVGIGLGVDGLQYSLDEECLLRLGLVEGDLEVVADELVVQLNRAATLAV
jgi:putative nucleotidyltransferase with HDIG domain